LILNKESILKLLGSKEESILKLIWIL